MSSPLIHYIIAGARIGIRRPTAEDCDAFVAAVARSVDLHVPWVNPPSTPEQFAVYLKSRQSPLEDGFLVCELASGKIAGLINLNCIVRGSLQSAYLGYYAMRPFAGRGFMREGLSLVMRHAFGEMQLHRLEANIQPENAASIALVKGLCFRKEGFSPRYLLVGGEWRDHAYSYCNPRPRMPSRWRCKGR